MNPQINETFVTTTKFHSVEQLWFWFLYTKQLRNGFSYQNNRGGGKKICELLDVETLITRLYLSGKLTDEHLSVMKEFGDKRRCPHQHIWAENKKAAVWNAAMQIINTEAVKKGWLI